MGGVVYGSIAAYIQSLIGNVAARSLFSILQSLGALGFGSTLITVGIVLLVVGGASFWAIKRYSSSGSS